MDRLHAHRIAVRPAVSALFVLVAGCSSTPKHDPAAADRSCRRSRQPEVSLQDRAKLHTGARRRLLRTRPDGHRARGTRRGGEARPGQRPDLQHLRARLRLDGRERQGRAELPARALARAAGLRARQNWGWYLCTTGRARESIPEFELARRQPAVQDTRNRVDQRRRGAARRSATSRTRSLLQACARDRAEQRERRVRARAARVQGERLDEARVWMRRASRSRIRRRRRSSSGCASNAGRRPGRRSCRTSRSCATGIRTRPRPRPSPRGAASDRAICHSTRRRHAPPHRARPPAPCFARRARRRGCRSTPSRSS